MHNPVLQVISALLQASPAGLNEFAIHRELAGHEAFRELKKGKKGSDPFNLGLWNYPVTAFTLEILLLAGGMLWYARTTSAFSRRRVYGLLLFGVLMVLVQARVFFGAPPTSDREVAITALFAYFLFAAIAYWLDRKPAKQTTEASRDLRQNNADIYQV